ncbi:MAG: Hint domain-containing protein [Marinibacterium sp.]|nr:Hint domain-containing protein [Marinibacterium sp.]
MRDTTLTDDDSDTAFQIDDPINGSGQIKYVGQVEIQRADGSGSVNMPVLARGDLPYVPGFIVYYPANTEPSDFDFPPTIDPETVDTSSDFPVCFLPGTRIATPQGGRAVETLAPGDQILTADGRTVAICFVGRQTVLTAFAPPERLMPVRLAAGCLGEGMPVRDLTLTSDHALLIDGVLAQAGALVNGTTITRVPLAEFDGQYTVYHIETDAHEVILAEGAPAETFIDNVSRRVFDNFNEFTARYGAPGQMVELDYPRACSVRQLPAAIKTRLGLHQVA